MSDQETQDVIPCDPKELAYYQASLTAYLETKLAGDKALLTLSAGGIGLLVTLLTTQQNLTISLFVLHSLAIISFIICIACVLIVLHYNGKHIINSIQNDTKYKHLLEIFDSIARFVFINGLLLSLAIGIVTGIQKIS